ncbi:MAG: Hsp20/alpha crystallin family protein [Verrucomicrobiae bacterium]|nr:Hsp20/alpha crystallin family protein [Verrucomicrobiae bacterium]
MPKYWSGHFHHASAILRVALPTEPAAWSPNTDVYETAEHFIVKLELAGVRREDLEITLQDRLLIVRGYRHDSCPHRQNRCSFRQMEIDYGHFERRILLPSPVNASNAQAHYHNGFLRIELPKVSQPGAPATTVVIEQIS